MKKINNLCHYIIGFSVAFTIGNITNFNEFDTFGKIIAIPILSLFFGLCVGFFIEWIENIFTKQPYDDCDIARTMIGSLIGGLFATLFPNLNLFMYFCLVISGILCLVEIYFLYKIYKQRK